MAVLGGLVAWRGTQAAEQEVRQQQVSLARLGASGVGTALESTLAAATVLALDGALAEQEALGPTGEGRLRAILDAVALANPAWESVSLTGPDGVVIASSRDAVGVALGDRDYVAAALDQGREDVSPVVTSRITGEQAVFAAVPVQLDQGRGAIVIRLATAQLTEALNSTLVPDQEPGLALLLLDGVGAVIASTSGLPTGDASLSGLVTAAPFPQSGGVLADAAGPDILVAAAGVPERDWTVVALQPADVALGAVRTQLREATFLLAGVAAGGALLAWFVGRRLRVAYEAEVDALRQAQEASAARDTFLAAAGHDLKTPLTAILASGQALQRRARRGGGLDDASLTLVDQVILSGRRMAGMIDDLLDATRRGAGEEPARPRELVPVLPLVADAIRESQATTDRHTIQLEAVEDAAGWQVLGDRPRLQRVLDNLLSNAIKYSPAGGSIQVRVDRGGPGEIAIAVADQGIGIEAADRGRIFEPFERTGLAAGTVAGTGLGLASARATVEALGGRIAVDSTPGEGSIFTVLLPLRA